ncbi:hypothetical protein CWE15_01190 [Aliidiomarina taiwanensis]|uniref:VWFA domain-containing protein n=1 Tax=Aliidiomarina taiwanensis TaxID=946228 RepID=A0A432X9C2_9GAMM|nr:VWA domain-containing protein [Aliidiomarina taiwanensis]RUO43841.1 hypothetical protein CWE15_01190 [Aliidiomarina taiwanensis]
MDALHFLRPWWLLTLLPLLVLLPTWRKQLARSHSLKALVAPHLLTVLTEPAKQHGKHILWLAASCWLIASLAAAGPSWLRVQVPTYSLDYGRVIIMDASLSTRANDVRPDRFEQLKFKAHDLLSQVADGQTGLIAYAGDAFVVSPLTQDPDTILHMLSALSPEIMPEPGNHPLLAFQQAQQLLAQAGYQRADIIWLTGGIDRDQAEEVKQFIHQLPETQSYRVSVIAAGSQEGAPVRTQQGELLRDRQGRLVIPKLYPEYLQQITRLTGGRYFHAQADDSDIHSIVHQLPKQTQAQQAQSPGNYDEWLDLGPYFALLLLPLLFWLGLDLFGFKPRFIQRNTATQLLVLPAFACLIAFSYAPFAQAQDQIKEPFLASAFKNSQQRALSLYQQGHYHAASSASANPMLTGMAYYRSGDYQQAASTFAQLTSAEADFNRGNSLAKAGELEAAIQAYQDALSKRPGWSQAEANKALVEQLLDSSSQQQQGDTEQASSDPQQSREDEPGQESQEQSTSNSQQEQREADQREAAQNEAEPSQPSQTENEQNSEHAPSLEQEQEQEESQQAEGGFPAAWADLSEEEREQLQSLLKQLDDDPAALLRTRLLREAERRRLQRHY